MRHNYVPHTFALINLINLLALVFLLTSCGGGGDDPVSPGPTDEVLATGSIGPEGGTLDANGISLSVPAGAFAEVTELQWILVGEPDIELTTGPVFQLTGLPEAFSQPLTLAFPATVAKDDESPTFFLGELAHPTSLEGAHWLYRALTAELNQDQWHLILPAIPAEEATGSFKASVNEFNVQIAMSVDPESLLSSGGHFRLTYIPGWQDLADVEWAAASLETAYSYFLDQGFDYSRRTNWPVDVNIQRLQNAMVDAVGLYSSSRWGYNHGYMELHTDHLGNHADVKKTAGHEFFHLVQALYDTRGGGPIRRAIFPAPYHWFNEACSVWSEAAFSEETNHWPDLQKHFYLVPYEGLFTSVSEDAETAGYGNAGIPKYLEGQHGLGTVAAIYEQLASGMSLVPALEMEVGHIRQWWGHYLRAYTGGVTYPVPWSDLLRESHGQFIMTEPEHGYYTDEFDYPDLSGRIYRIDPRRDYHQDASLKLTTSGITGHIYAFHSSPSGAALMDSSTTGTLVLPDLAGMRANNWRLLILVTHEPGVEDDTAVTPGSFTVRVEEPLVDLTGFDRCTFLVHYIGDRLFGDGSTLTGAMAYQMENMSPVIFSGRDFSATVDLELGAPPWVFRYWGSLTGSLSPDFLEVAQFNLQLQGEHIFNDGSTQLMDDFSISLAGLPLASSSSSEATWEIVGPMACQTITDLNYADFTGDSIVSDYHCDALSRVRVVLHP